MSAMQSPARRGGPPGDDGGRSIARLVADHRAGLGSLAVLAAASLAGWFLWTRSAADLQARPDALLFPEQVDLRGVADWVRGDVRGEALHAASLDGGMPLDDPQLPARLRRAFEMHPWVQRVERITLAQPAAAVVEVRCREPVAMVRWNEGLLAVDGEGVVLPSRDFTGETAAEYPRITNVTSTPVGAEGTPWGDPLVHEAAAVAAVLGPEWAVLGLHEIRPLAGGRGTVWELAAADGRTIVFGSAPGREADGEPSAAAKVARLKQVAATTEPADRIDLRHDPPSPASP